MNTKGTSPLQSGQTSVIPHSNSLQRNGHLSCTTSSTLSAPLPKRTNLVTNAANSDGVEMQIIVHQRKTLEAFHELEHLVPNGITDRASIVRMSSIIQDPDDTLIDLPVHKQPTAIHSNHC